MKSKAAKPIAAVASTSKDAATAKKGKNPEWAWKDVLPKEGEPTTKEFKGKHCHSACKFHPDSWVCHTSEAYSENPANAASASSSTPKTDSGEKKTSSLCRLMAAKLAAALLEEDENEATDDDDSPDC